ncbi:MAG: 5-(carboxyamino)imidazole ribonucleotide mutase [Candidatus Aminicenantes bacterium]|nr:5-(carboxyamino)imidazole ribonucleotide mutase [Candidatus Aminicenantes bacterium]
MDVAIFIGSESDYDIVREAIDVLKSFGVTAALEVTSAHRSPERTRKLIFALEEKGARVFIAAAGKAAHLAGFVAAHTTAPVIGIPVESAGLGGLDALLSTVQMPKGVPVATMGLGRTGAANAALLAVAILCLKNPRLKKKLKDYRAKLAAQVEEASRRLRQKT